MLCRGDLPVDFRQAPALLRQRCLHIGLFITVVVGEAFFIRNAIEISKQPVEIFLRDWIVLVIVATGATHGKTHPHGRGGLSAIGHVFNAILFGNNSAFAAGSMISIESCGDLLIESWIRQ